MCLHFVTSTPHISEGAVFRFGLCPARLGIGTKVLANRTLHTTPAPHSTIRILKPTHCATTHYAHCTLHTSHSAHSALCTHAYFCLACKLCANMANSVTVQAVLTNTLPYVATVQIVPSGVNATTATLSG